MVNFKEIYHISRFQKKSLIFQGFKRNLSYFKVSEGVQHFPGGGPFFFQGGPIAYSL